MSQQPSLRPSPYGLFIANSHNRRDWQSPSSILPPPVRSDGFPPIRRQPQPNTSDRRARNISEEAVTSFSTPSSDGVSFLRDFGSATGRSGPEPPIVQRAGRQQLRPSYRVPNNAGTASSPTRWLHEPPENHEVQLPASREENVSLIFLLDTFVNHLYKISGVIGSIFDGAHGIGQRSASIC